MGQHQNTSDRGSLARSGQRLRPRVCLRKGCDRRYQPSRWNQRYCQDPACLLEVRRWQAARRQHKRRQEPENRKQHAAAEAERRKRRRELGKDACQHAAACPENGSNRQAWSRSKANSEFFCDRPGCYAPRRVSHRAPARYCSDDCRGCVRRVRDRERKWLKRNTYTDCHPHRQRHETVLPWQGFSPRRPSAVPRNRTTSSVRNYGTNDGSGLFYWRFEPKEVRNDHQETHPGSRPRPPPTS